MSKVQAVMPALRELIDFIETLSLDDAMYWRVPRLSSSNDPEIEVQWDRRRTNERWQMRQIDSETWTSATRHDVMATLDVWQADSENFAQQLRSSVLTQAVYADLLRRRAVELFGSDAIDQAAEDTAAFLAAVRNAAAQMTMTPVANAVHEAAPAPAAARRGLRLVNASAP